MTSNKCVRVNADVTFTLQSYEIDSNVTSESEPRKPTAPCFSARISLQFPPPPAPATLHKADPDRITNSVKQTEDVIPSGRK